MAYDPSLEILAGLEPGTRVRAIYLLNAFRNAGVPLVASSGRRTIWQQSILVARGASRTYNSKHLVGKAFDIDVAGWSRDALPQSFWLILWRYAESLGLNAPYKSWDKGHLETP